MIASSMFSTRGPDLDMMKRYRGRVWKKVDEGGEKGQKDEEEKGEVKEEEVE